MHHFQNEYIVLDLSSVSYMDSAGAKFIGKLRSDFYKEGIILCLAGISESGFHLLERTESLVNFETQYLFHSLHDAVTILVAQK